MYTTANNSPIICGAITGELIVLHDMQTILYNVNIFYRFSRC